MTLDEASAKFVELGPEAFLTLKWDITDPIGWSGSVVWCDENGDDVSVEVSNSDDWWNESPETLLEELYRRALVVKNGREG